MQYDLGAEEVLATAVRIEQEGAEFYLRASEIMKEPEARRELEKLAGMEREHEEKFADLKSRASMLSGKNLGSSP